MVMTCCCEWTPRNVFIWVCGIEVVQTIFGLVWTTMSLGETRNVDIVNSFYMIGVVLGWIFLAMAFYAAYKNDVGLVRIFFVWFTFAFVYFFIIGLVSFFFIGEECDYDWIYADKSSTSNSHVFKNNCRRTNILIKLVTTIFLTVFRVYMVCSTNRYFTYLLGEQVELIRSSINESQRIQQEFVNSSSIDMTSMSHKAQVSGSMDDNTTIHKPEDEVVDPDSKYDIEQNTAEYDPDLSNINTNTSTSDTMKNTSRKNIHIKLPHMHAKKEPKLQPKEKEKEFARFVIEDEEPTTAKNVVTAPSVVDDSDLENKPILTKIGQDSSD